MAKARIQIARPDIIRHFDELPAKVLRQADLARQLADQRTFWRLTQRTSVTEFVTFLMSSGKLQKYTFPFPPPYKRETRFVWGDVPWYEVLLSLKRDSYFSHYTAVHIHGLTEQVPKTIYLNDEQRLESWLSGTLTQKGIDAAFRRPVRVTNNIAETEDYRICIISGKNTQKLGVIDEPLTADGKTVGTVRVTNVERTLVDIAVRPVYSGGVDAVLKAYRFAKELDKISVNRLAATLKKLKYIYPYHQVVGFYLDRTGYQGKLLDLFRRIPQEFDFYLAHAMKDTEYVKEWRLHVPKGL
jgi:hypothetical protein